MDGFGGFEAHWVWATLGLILAALEIMVPGVYLIWLAVAALATGLLTYLFDLSLAMQVIDFVSLALIAAFSAKRFLRDKPIVGADPKLNRPGLRLAGETAIVTTPFESDHGRVKVGDSEWLARLPAGSANIALGERVRITGSDGSSLLVEPMPLLAGEQGQTIEGRAAPADRSSPESGET